LWLPNPAGACRHFRRPRQWGSRSRQGTRYCTPPRPHWLHDVSREVATANQIPHCAKGLRLITCTCTTPVSSMSGGTYFRQPELRIWGTGCHFKVPTMEPEMEPFAATLSLLNSSLFITTCTRHRPREDWRGLRQNV